ncbi:MAG: beta-lactamase family protein [Bacteroidia bacterium]|nr:beta-lactamase family protein [Bacteroidia bacterium]NNF30914.1 serine hydrolase [Flavobacteriaceae bacterium]
MEALDAIIENQIKGIQPGLTVGVVKDMKIVYERYAGFSNLAHQIPVDSSTRFNIASNAKQYTAFMILYLEDLGKLKITDDFRKYLPEYFPEIKSPITIGNLLNHSSGIRDFYELMSLEGRTWWKHVGLDNNDALELLRKQTALNFEPGSQHLYSNSNYTLLTEVVKSVSGQSFPKAIATLFDSLGMPNTRFQTNYMSVIPNKALPYSDWGDGVWKQYPMVTNLYGDGFLFTTLRDQLKWEMQIQEMYSDIDPVELLAKSQKPIPGSEIENYGFGIEFGNYKGKQIVYHEGATGSYSAYFIRIPSETVSVVVMTNNGSVWSEGLAKEILDEVVVFNAEEDHPGMPSAIGARPGLEALPGDYLLKDGTLIKLYLEKRKLFRSIYNREPVEIVHEKGNVFRYATIENLKMVFVANATNSYDFELYMPGTPVRIAPRLPEQSILDNWENADGTYVNSELGVKFQMQYKEGRTFEISMRDNSYTAELLRNDWIQMGDYKLNIERNKSGEITALLLDQNRLRNVRFSKRL